MIEALVVLNDDPEDDDDVPATKVDAVYAGKFLHCLETESNLRILLRRVWQLMVPGGVFFGIYGRNYQPAFECASKADFTRVLTEEGFAVEMVLEESAGATWFCAYKKDTSSSS